MLKIQQVDTALIAAALFGQTAASLLIDAGADLELKNNEGSTALITVFVGREGIVKSLLKSGADLSARNKAGLTALDSVQGSFADAKPIYDLIQSVFGPYGLSWIMRL